eukprot:5889370-Alexandrium_andersonii.AAC.1
MVRRGEPRPGVRPGPLTPRERPAQALELRAAGQRYDLSEGADAVHDRHGDGLRRNCVLFRVADGLGLEAG